MSLALLISRADFLPEAAMGTIWRSRRASPASDVELREVLAVGGTAPISTAFATRCVPGQEFDAERIDANVRSEWSRAKRAAEFAVVGGILLSQDLFD
jgi:hypothetical protein